MKKGALEEYCCCICYVCNMFCKDIVSIVVVHDKENIGDRPTIFLAGLPWHLCIMSLFAFLQELQNRICCSQYLQGLEGLRWHLLVSWVVVQLLGEGWSLWVCDM